MGPQAQNLVWKIFARVIAAGTAVLAAKTLEGAWRMATGDEPPEATDPRTPWRHAVIWAIASGVGLAAAQLLTSRLAARVWSKATGTPAPHSSGQL